MTFRGNPASPSLFGTTPFPAPLPASSAPQGLVTGDFTSDGRADLVTVLSATNQAVVVKGDSGSTCVQSSFEAARSFAAGDGPVAVAAADFDEDGRADLVAAAGTGSAISFLKGTPAGYGPPVGYPVSPAPRGVATADFNFDGHADVVAALGTIGSGKVQVYLGDGTGLLVAGFSANVGNNLAAVAVGDFNGDGAPDVAVASEATDEVLVLLGNGAGGFGAPISTPVDDAPRAIVTGDFDGVGLKDLAVACSGSNTVRVLLASGSGTFTAGSTPNVGTEPWGIAAADLDGDTRTDIVTANHGANTVSVLKGTGTGTFAAAVSYRWTRTRRVSPCCGWTTPPGPTSSSRPPASTPSTSCSTTAAGASRSPCPRAASRCDRAPRPSCPWTSTWTGGSTWSSPAGRPTRWSSSSHGRRRSRGRRGSRSGRSRRAPPPRTWTVTATSTWP